MTEIETHGHHNPPEDDAAIVELAERARETHYLNTGSTLPIAVEVGCWMGSTTILLADLGFRVFAVDHWKADGTPDSMMTKKYKELGQENLYKQFCTNVDSYLLRSIFPLIGSSAIMAEIWPKDLKISFLFIDGAHDYANALADIQAWSPLVAEGGIVAIHDFGVFSGVSRAVIETGPHAPAGKFVAWRQM